jgi:carbamoyl-phosphate synthase small subunit
MSSTSSPRAVLILKDGTSFEGRAFGKIGTATGEICFNTGMTGYQEVFTDPSYYGQVLIMNTVHTGNYGINVTDVESGSVKVKAVIGRNLEEKFSRFMAQKSLQEYFEQEQIVAIDGVDTRALVEHIRRNGAMNCIISSNGTSMEQLVADLDTVPSMDGLELASTVSTAEAYCLGNAGSSIRIAVLDYGIKKNILNCLVQRGAYIKVHNAKTNFEELEQFAPHGYFISNGPGDPAPMQYAVDTIKKILATDKPVFGSVLDTSCWHWPTVSALLKCITGTGG